LRKPISTLSIPGTVKGAGMGGDRKGGGEEDAALVGVHAEYPKYMEEKSRKASSLIATGKAKSHNNSHDSVIYSIFRLA
jgi:hypothetical protein